MEDEITSATVQMNVRLPKAVRDRVHEYAVAQGISVNRTVTLVLVQHLALSGYPPLPAVLPAVPPPAQ